VRAELPIISIRIYFCEGQVLAPGKYPQNVKARSLLCYWATRELGMTTIELSKKLKLSQPTISQSAKRGQKIAQKLGLRLIEKGEQ